MWFMATFLGIASVIPVGLFVSTSLRALAIASLAPPATLALIPILAIVSQIRR